MKPVLGRLFRHTTVYGGALVISKSLVLLLLPVYSRQLSPSQFGVYSLLLTSATVITGVISLGFGTALVRHAVMRPDTDPRDYYVSALIGLVALTLLMLPPAYALAPWIAGWLLQDRSLASWVFLTFLAAASSVLMLVTGSYLRFRERPVAYSAIRIVQAFALGGCNVLVLVALGAGIRQLLMNEAIVTALALAISVYVCRDGLGGRFRREALRDLLRYGLPLIPATMAMTALQSADRYFLNGLGYADELGLYAMAYRFGFVLYLVVSALQTAWPPVMYGPAGEPDAPPRFAAIYTYLITLFLWIGLALVLFSPPLVALLTTSAYWDGSRVLPLVVPAYVLHAVYAIISLTIYRSGHTGVIAGAVVGAAALNIGLNALLVPSGGMMGAALATFAAYVVLVVVTGIAAHRVYPVPYEWARMARVTVVAVAIAALAALIGSDLGSARSWVVAAVGTALFPVVLIGTRTFSADELRGARDALTRLGRRRRVAGRTPGGTASPPVGGV